MSGAKRRLSDEVEQGRLRTTLTGGMAKLLSVIPPWLIPPLPILNKGGGALQSPSA